MQSILSHFENHVLTLSFNRADKKNALTREMYQQLADALIAAEQDPEVKVILLKGEGDGFTAGNDIADFAHRNEGDNVAEVVAFMNALCACSNPVVAQVHGVAVGIGTTLLLHCDLVYSAPESVFCLPFINLGLVPEYASSYILPRIAGKRKASEWLMLGETFGAQEACDYGVVTGIVPANQLDEHVSNVCKKLAQKPSFALKQTKLLMNNERDAVQQQISTELDIFLEALGSEAAKEAFDAFINKRPVNRDKFK